MERATATVLLTSKKGYEPHPRQTSPAPDVTPCPLRGGATWEPVGGGGETSCLNQLSLQFPLSAHPDPPSTRPVRNWEVEEPGHPATLGPTSNLLCGLQQDTEPL